MEKKIRTIAALNSHNVSVNLDEVILRNGKRGERIKIIHPEAAAVIAFLSEDEILMVRQYRYALERQTLEIPAGKVDPGETAEECAARELMEETGYKAEKLDLVCTYAPAIGYSSELIHVYSAKILQQAGQGFDQREISSVEKMRLSEVWEMVKKGEIVDGKTLLSLSMLKIVGEP